MAFRRDKDEQPTSWARLANRYALIDGDAIYLLVGY